MEQHKTPQKMSRRKMVAGLAASAGVGMALVGGAYAITELAKDTDKAAAKPAIRSMPVSGDLPATDPESSTWRSAEAQKIAVEGQAVIIPLKPAPSVNEVVVRSLHDGQTIAFLLEWEDRERDEHTIKINDFRDACGVLLGPSSTSATLWMMGTPQEPVTILHWKADWQLDIDAGFQDLEVAFPNASFDFYPPLVGVVQPRIPDDYPEQTRERLPGWFVGNPLSQPVKTSPVEKLLGIGPGTLEHLPTQNAVGRGVWKNGKWRVALARPMSATDDQELSLAPGNSYSVAFTVWSGADSDRGARKSLTQLGTLSVEAAS